MTQLFPKIRPSRAAMQLGQNADASNFGRWAVLVANRAIADLRDINRDSAMSKIVVNVRHALIQRDLTRRRSSARHLHTSSIDVCRRPVQGPLLRR